ncbi:MAG: hypothetical protein ACK41D_07985 [Rubricoccaceae bacterium]
MLWLFVLTPILVTVAALALLPVGAVRASSHAVQRLDGSLSARRARVERLSLRRYVLHGVLVPVVLATALSGLLFGLYAFVPWTPLAHVFGETTPETALVAETLVADYRARADAAARARLDEAVRAGQHVGAWWHAAHAARVNVHLNVLVLLILTGFYVALGRYMWRARTAYRAAARTRRRQYALADRRRLGAEA